MKNIFKNFILLSILITFFGLTTLVEAASLDATFNPDPLFSELNFLPGDSAGGSVSVTNNSGVTQNILTEAINASDNDNLGSQLQINISGINGSLYSDTLADFLSTAGEVPLGVINDGETKNFTYTVTFINTNDNNYQGKTLGFDVCIGFEGGNAHCGNTVVGNENSGGPEDSGGGITSTSSGPNLNIFGEDENYVAEPLQTMLITWNTNLLSTSQVVYGPASGGPYTLDLNAANFGYPFGTTEDLNKVTNHSVLLTDLLPGETYLYRAVSRASPPTVSFERNFVVPTTTQAENRGAPTATQEDEVEENLSEGTGGLALGFSGASDNSPETQNNLSASVISANLENSYLWIMTLFLFLICLCIYLRRIV